MAIKAILDKIEDAPEALRDHYVAGTAENGADGKFVLAVEPVGGFALEDVSGLKSALGKERTTREKLERDVVAFKDLDPTKARAALTELEELKKLDPTAEADKIANTKFEAAKAQLLEKHGQEVGQRDERIGKLTGAVDRLVRQAAATAAIAEAKGSVELLLPHVLAHTKVKETEAGDFIVEVVDKDGNARIGDARGGAMDLRGLVAEMRESDTYARAFDGDGHSGSGKQIDHNPGRAPKGDFGGSREERRAAIASKFKLPA
jgi:hypothetical protein